MKAIRYDSLYNIIKTYPPKHTYLKDEYWFEKIPDDRFKEQANVKINPNFNIDDVIKEHPIDGIIEYSDIIAFNYLWPAYGLAFFERSLKAILPHVKKYILFLNKYSYIGEEASEEALSYIQDICTKYDKVEVRYNASQEHPESVKVDNIGHYFALATTFAETNKADYVWLVQTDEVYDEKSLKLIQDGFRSGLFKNKASILQPLCYIDNPHWVVDPPEEFNRPTIIDVKSMVVANYNYTKVEKQKLSAEFCFHHLSQVLRRYEFDAKYKNWGHRDNVADKLSSYQKLIDANKTNKSLINLHPIQPDLYKSVKFVNNQINIDMFYDWVHYLLLINNPYDSIKTLFEDTVFDFPNTPDKQFTLSESERRLISSIISEWVPVHGQVAEYGSWNGYSPLLMKLVNPNIMLYAADNYGKPDDLFAQYGDSMARVYQLAIKKIIDFNLSNIHIFNGNTKIFSLLKNDSLDLVFLHNGINPDNLRNAIIETWPKIKHCGIICGQYSMNDNISKIIKEVIDRDVTVKCPWGQQMFNFYEVYYNVLDDIQKEFSINLQPQYGFWMARVNKLG